MPNRFSPLYSRASCLQRPGDAVRAQTVVAGNLLSAAVVVLFIVALPQPLWALDASLSAAGGAFRVSDGHVTIVDRATGNRGTSTGLDKNAAVWLRGEGYFEEKKWFGLAGEFFYTDFTSTIQAVGGPVPQTNFVNLTDVGISLLAMARVPGWVIEPYAGAGIQAATVSVTTVTVSQGAAVHRTEDARDLATVGGVFVGGAKAFFGEHFYIYSEARYSAFIDRRIRLFSETLETLIGSRLATFGGGIGFRF